KLPVNGAQEDNGGSRRWPFSPRGPAGTITWPSVQGTITWPTGQVMVHYTRDGRCGRLGDGGPGRTRTYDQGIHSLRRFRREWTISSPAGDSPGRVRDARACH